MSETDMLFREITRGLEYFEGRGFVQYEDVSPDLLAELHKSLYEHLYTIGAIDPGSTEVEVESHTKHLMRLLQKDIGFLNLFNLDDEVIGSEVGVAIIVSEAGYKLEVLSDAVRLHGKVMRETVLEVPTLESIYQTENGSGIAYDRIIDHPAVVLELGAASIEFDRRFMIPEEGSHVYLPLCYEGTRVQKHSCD